MGGYEAEEEAHLTAFRDMPGLKQRLQQSQDECRALALAVHQAAQQLLAHYKPRESVATSPHGGTLTLGKRVQDASQEGSCLLHPSDPPP